MTRTRDLSNNDLMVLAQQTYEKVWWTTEDVRFLRECWHEMMKRGGENAIMFFRPAYFGVLKFHEIDSGEVDEECVQMMERSEAAIAPDYRDVMRKLAASDAAEPVRGS